MFDPDTDEDVYREHSDVTCPECGHTEPVVPDVLGFYSSRRPHKIVWSFLCEKCDHDWEWDEDLRDD